MVNNGKLKKVSITSFNKIMKEINTPIEIVEWHGIKITVQKTLPLVDVLTFVDRVFTGCFDEETNSYVPEVKDFAVKCCILELYANFSLPSNVEHKYDLIYNTDAVDVVMKHINTVQFNDIIDSINTKINCTLQADMDTINKQMRNIYDSFYEMQRNIERIFSNIQSEDLSNLIHALSGKNFDESKLVQAYIEKSNLSKDDKSGD